MKTKSNFLLHMLAQNPLMGLGLIIGTALLIIVFGRQLTSMSGETRSQADTTSALPEVSLVAGYGDRDPVKPGMQLRPGDVGTVKVMIKPNSTRLIGAHLQTSFDNNFSQLMEANQTQVTANSWGFTGLHDTQFFTDSNNARILVGTSPSIYITGSRSTEAGWISVKAKPDTGSASSTSTYLTMASPVKIMTTTGVEDLVFLELPRIMFEILPTALPTAATSPTILPTYSVTSAPTQLPVSPSPTLGSNPSGLSVTWAGLCYVASKDPYWNRIYYTVQTKNKTTQTLPKGTGLELIVNSPELRVDSVPVIKQKLLLPKDLSPQANYEFRYHLEKDMAGPERKNTWFGQKQWLIVPHPIVTGGLSSLYFGQNIPACSS